MVRNFFFFRFRGDRPANWGRGEGGGGSMERSGQRL